MAIFYRVIQKRIPGGEEAGTYKWYGQTSAGTRLTFDKLCERVGRHSTATPSDVAVVMKEALTRMADYLAEGNIVQMGGLGSIRLTAGSEGSETKEDFTLRNMRRPRVTFAPTKDIRRRLQDVGFRKKNCKVEVSEGEPCPFPKAPLNPPEGREV